MQFDPSTVDTRDGNLWTNETRRAGIFQYSYKVNAGPLLVSSLFGASEFSSMQNNCLDYSRYRPVFSYLYFWSTRSIKLLHSPRCFETSVALVWTVCGSIRAPTFVSHEQIGLNTSSSQLQELNWIRAKLFRIRIMDWTFKLLCWRCINNSETETLMISHVPACPIHSTQHVRQSG